MPSDVTVLALQLFQAERSFRIVVLERSTHLPIRWEAVRGYRPRLREVGKVCQLCKLRVSTTVEFTVRLTHRAPERAELPIQDANDTILSWVEDEIVELVVAMDYPQSGLALVRKVGFVPGDHFSEPRYLPGRLAGLDVDSLRLCLGYGTEGLDLSREIGLIGCEV